MTKHFFEATMMVCFSSSWFFAIARSLRSRSTGGKSIWFLWIIVVGYLAGMVHKYFNDLNWVIGLYGFNAMMVSIDIALYYRNWLYERRQKRQA